MNKTFYDNYPFTGPPSSTSSVTTTGATQVEPVIENISNQLETQLLQLSEAIAQLEGRLGAVMGEPESNATPSRAEIPTRAAQSPLASALRQRVLESDNLLSRLLSIIRRLEI